MKENKIKSNKTHKLITQLDKNDIVYKEALIKSESLSRQRDSIFNARVRLTTDFIKSNPESYYPILANDLMVYISQGYLSIDSARVIFNTLNERVRAYTRSIEMDKYLKIYENTRVGNKAPDFIVNDINGKKIQLSDYRGKYVLLDFWASWCSPCIQAIPHLKTLYSNYKSKDFEIIGISCDDSKEDWIKGVEKYDLLDWCNVGYVQDFTKYKQGVINDDDIARKYPTDGIPKYILIDPEGMIIKKWEGYSIENEKNLDEAMNEIFGN